MSPPKLAADAPILNVAHPVVINLRPALGMKLSSRRSSRHALSRATCFHARIFQKPLLAQARLDRHIRAFAVTDVVRVRLFLLQRAEFREFFHGHLARLETVQARQVRARQRRSSCRPVHDFNHRQLVPLADFKVRLVMRRRHFQNAGAELKIHMLVADDRNELLSRAAIQTGSGRMTCLPMRCA